MLNKVIQIGRLTRDPEIRFLPSGSQVTSFSIAVNRNYKVGEDWREETYYFDVETFGNLAERLGKQLNKGYQILLEGQLRQDRWETSSGEKRSKIKIVADKVSILSKPNSNSNNSNKNQSTIGNENVELVEDEIPGISADDIAEDIDNEEVPF